MATLPQNFSELIEFINRFPPDKLAYTVNSFSQASGIGTSYLYEDIKNGNLKTRLLGDGKRKKHIITREYGIEYLYSFPPSYEEGGDAA